MLDTMRGPLDLVRIQTADEISSNGDGTKAVNEFNFPPAIAEPEASKIRR